MRIVEPLQLFLAVAFHSSKVAHTSAKVEAFTRHFRQLQPSEKLRYSLTIQERSLFEERCAENVGAFSFSSVPVLELFIAFRADVASRRMDLWNVTQRAQYRDFYFHNRRGTEPTTCYAVAQRVMKLVENYMSYSNDHESRSRKKRLLEENGKKTVVLRSPSDYSVTLGHGSEGEAILIEKVVAAGRGMHMYEAARRIGQAYRSKRCGE